MSPRALPPKVLRELRDLVASLPEDVPNISARRCDALVAAIDAALATKRSVRLARKRVRAKKASRKEKVSELRAQVVARAGGRCECRNCGYTLGAYDYGEMDHFVGGSRRRSHETLEGVWMLSRYCHGLKTANHPSSVHWLRLFLKHSAKYGYDGPTQRDAQARLESLTLQNQTGEG